MKLYLVGLSLLSLSCGGESSFSGSSKRRASSQKVEVQDPEKLADTFEADLQAEEKSKILRSRQPRM